VLAACTCTLLKKRIAAFAEAQIPAAHAMASFEGYRPGNESQDRAKKAAMAFAFGYRRGARTKGYVLGGPVGAGKTHLLATTLAHLVLEVGVRARYVEISQLYLRIRRGFQDGKSGGEIIDPLTQFEVLAIDEIGKGRGSPFEMETLDELIARRYNASRTTLFATNYSLRPPERALASGGFSARGTQEILASGKDEERTLCDRVGDRIYSRLCEMCDFIELPPSTPDHRRARQELR
jgi:DNA replication protein DnaC